MPEDITNDPLFWIMEEQKYLYEQQCLYELHLQSINY